MVSLPALAAVTTPETWVACVLEKDQIPPGCVSDSVTTFPGHKDNVPEIMPADAPTFMVIGKDAVIEPHTDVVVYVMVSSPAAVPLMTFPEAKALLLVVFQLPPEIVSDMVIMPP